MKQNGSTHVIVIVVLVLALIGTLGYIFWQNFIDSSQSKNQSTTTEAAKTESSKTVAKIDLLDASINKDFGTTLEFKYPKSWKYSSDVTGNKHETWMEKVTISSPSGAHTVTYTVGSGAGIGGVCIPEETGVISSASYETLSGLPELSFVELTHKNMPSADYGGPLNPKGYVGLIKTDIAKNLSVGDSSCKVYLSDILLLDEQKSVLLLGIELVTNDAFSISKDLKDSEYTQAKDILLSTSRR